MKKLDLEQGSKEWLELRKNMVGASDAPSIMGVGFKTPYQLWMDKMGLSETKQTDAMKRGLDLEPIARQKFMEIIALDVFPAVALHDSIPFMMASFDGISDMGSIVVEIKCPGSVDHEMAMDGVIPEKYIPQLQHQMEIAEINSMFYFSYTEKSCKILEINKDNSFIKDMLKKEKEFWDCMQNWKEPELIERDYIKIVSEEWDNLAKELIEISKIEDRKEEIRKRLIEISEKKNSMGAGIKLSKILRKGTLDYKAIPELMEVNLEKYRKATIETYRIGIC